MFSGVQVSALPGPFWTALSRLYLKFEALPQSEWCVVLSGARTCYPSIHSTSFPVPEKHFFLNDAATIMLHHRDGFNQSVSCTWFLLSNMLTSTPKCSIFVWSFLPPSTLRGFYVFIENFWYGSMSGRFLVALLECLLLVCMYLFINLDLVISNSRPIFLSVTQQQPIKVQRHHSGALLWPLLYGTPLPTTKVSMLPLRHTIFKLLAHVTPWGGVTHTKDSAVCPLPDVWAHRLAGITTWQYRERVSPSLP